MKNQQGFTLIELMIVVAIIAILAGILIPNFTHARAQAQTAACESNLREIATALELYYADNQFYPKVANNTQTDVTPANIGATYLNNTPQDSAAATAPNQTYKFEVFPAGATAASYVISCPGTHDPTTLQKIQSGTTNTKLNYTSGTGLGTQ